MLNFFANGLVIAGAGILFGSLIPARRLLIQLPVGGVRTSWYFMTALTMLFIAGYLEYAKMFWNKYGQVSDLVVPSVFFFGACFVGTSCILSLQAVNNVRRITLLERENITDPLSGIYNRRYLDRRLEEELEKAQRYNLPLSILLIDIDHFKQINDTLGHQAGDRILGNLGKLILNATRASDIAARYGGDEFLIIAPNTPGSQASAVAERLRLQIESQVLVLSNAEGQAREVHVTVCIGVASCVQEIDCLQKLVQAADEAMYRAKVAGRNRITTKNRP